MTKFRRIIILVFIISMMLSIGGCSKDPNNAYEGLSVVDGQYLVNNGVTEYQIVIPAEISALMQLASSDLNRFISEATGVSIPVVKDSEVTGEGKFISIGKTTLLQDTNIS